MNLTLSVCVVQAMTDFVDRMIVLAVVLVILPPFLLLSAVFL